MFVPFVSFCTVTMGRLHHLMETLPRNLELLSGDPNVEFVILDYNSPDNEYDWVVSNFQKEIETGRIRCFRDITARFFLMSHSKNVAHKLASGDILCNLDVDNFVGRDFSSYLRNLLPSPGFLATPGNAGQISGRIALWKEDFWKLGGYNEDFIWGWGCDDCDLVERARRTGIKISTIDISVCEGIGAIIHEGDHSEELSIQVNKYRAGSVQRIIQDATLAKEEYVSNCGFVWGHAVVIDSNRRERIVA